MTYCFILQVACLTLSLLAGVTLCQELKNHPLPVLFQYVAVFRGAELKQEIAAGLVPGFGNLGRQGKFLVYDSADDMAAAVTKVAADAKAAADARARATAAKAAADARAAVEAKASADARARAAAAKAAAEAKAAEEARARDAAAKAADDARAAEEARQARSRTLELDPVWFL